MSWPSSLELTSNLRKATSSPTPPPSAEPPQAETGAPGLSSESIRQDSGAGFNERREEGRLRPTTLADYVGQEGIKANLKIFIQAAAGRKEPLDHALLY